MGVLDTFAKSRYEKKIKKAIEKQVSGDDRFNQTDPKINEGSSLVFIGGINLKNNELSNYIKDLDNRVTQGIATKQQEDGKEDTYTLKLQITDELEGYLNIIPHTLGTCLALGVQKYSPQNFKPRKIYSFRISNKERYIFVKKLLIPEIERMQRIKDYVDLDNRSETSNKPNTNRMFSKILKTLPSGINRNLGWIEEGKQHKTKNITARAEVYISDAEEYNNNIINNNFARVELRLPDEYIKQYISKFIMPEKENDNLEKDPKLLKSSSHYTKEILVDDGINATIHYIRKILYNGINATIEVHHFNTGGMDLGVYIDKDSVRKIFDNWDLSMKIGEQNARKAVRDELNKLIESELMGELTQLGNVIDEIGQNR